jgi:hypothetical protein
LGYPQVKEHLGIVRPMRIIDISVTIQHDPADRLWSLVNSL